MKVGLMSRKETQAMMSVRCTSSPLRVDFIATAIRGAAYTASVAPNAMEVIKLEDDDAMDNDLVLPQPQQPPQLSIAVMILVPFTSEQTRNLPFPAGCPVWFDARFQRLNYVRVCEGRVKLASMDIS